MIQVPQKSTTSDMQGLFWGKALLAHEYDFDVENIIIYRRIGSLKYAEMLVYCRNLVE